MLEKIQQLKAEIASLEAKTPQEVEALRIKYLSKKGAVSALMADFRNVPADQKKTVGMEINALKNLATEKINALKAATESADVLDESLDLSRSASPVALGTRHPLMLVRDEIVSIFSRLGFTVAEGPEVEDDWHVF